VKVPEITQVDFAQNSLSQAESALKQLVDQVGGLGRVPQEISNLFFDLTEQAKAAEQRNDLPEVCLRAGGRRSQGIHRPADEPGRRPQARRRRCQGRQRRGPQSGRRRPLSRWRAGHPIAARLRAVSPAADERHGRNRALEQRNAEEALFQARAKSDAAGIFAAEERLRLAKGAASEAQAQDRLRRFEARGLDANLLKPSRSILDDFKEVRSAFNAREINGDEARQALRNLAAEGIQIRQDILAELSRPSQKALQVNDIRTSEGISSFLGATREDPAIADRREQLLKLEEIRRALIAIGAQPVEILG
jgi:hypothetical protein